MTQQKPVVFTSHALQRMKERGATEEAVQEAIRIGEREPAHEGRIVYRLKLEFKREWDNRYYRVQQVAAVVVEEED